MRFLVHRCVRNQVIFSVAGLLLFSFIVWGVAALYLRLSADPALDQGQASTHPRKTLEERKRDITSYLSRKYKKQSDMVRRYVDLAFEEADKHPDVDPELILAVMQKESSMGHMMRSRYGAEGAMQVVRRFHKEKMTKHESLMTPGVNVRVGAQILQEYITETGAIEHALVKYSGNARGYTEFVMRETKVLQAI